MRTPTDRWTSGLDEKGDKGEVDLQTYKFAERTVLPELKKEGSVVFFDEWVEFLQETPCRLLGVDVLYRLIILVVSLVAPLGLATTPANAMYLLRSSLCGKLVGLALVAR